MSERSSAESTNIPARRGRPPKQPLDQVRSAVLDAALVSVESSGPRIGFENLNYEDAIKDAGVLRSAAYRIWPHRRDFMNDVMARGASLRLFGESDLGPRMLATTAEVLAGDLAALDSVEGRRRVLHAVVRGSFPVWVDELAASSRWRLRAALAVGAAESAGAAGVRTQRVGERLQEAAVDQLNAVSEYLRQVRCLLGLRLRDPAMTDDALAESTMAIVERWATLRVVVGSAETRDADDLRARMGRRVVGPDGRDDWSPGAVALMGVLDAFTELSTQGEYTPPQAVDIGALRSLGSLDVMGDHGFEQPQGVDSRQAAVGGGSVAGFPDSDVLVGHTAPVRALAATVTTAGLVLASGSEDGSVRLWDPVTGESAGPTMFGHEGWVLALTFVNVDGRTWLTSAGHDGTVRVWDPSDGSTRSVLQGHTGWVAALTYLDVADAPVLASGGADGLIRLWDLRTGSLAGDPVPTGDRHVDSLAAARVGDRDLIAVAGPRTGLRLFDPGQGSWRVLAEPTERVRSCDFGTTADGTVTVVAACGNVVSRWDARTGQPMGAGWTTGAKDVMSVSAIRDVNGAEVVAAGGTHGWLGVFSGVSRTARRPQGELAPTVWAVALGTLEGGRTVLASAVGHEILLWDASVRPLVSLDSVPNRLGSDMRDRALGAVERLPGAAESLQLFEDAAIGSMSLAQARELARQNRTEASVSNFEGMGMAPEVVVNRLLMPRTSGLR